jgi:hypothetical protein
MDDLYSFLFRIAFCSGWLSWRRLRRSEDIALCRTGTARGSDEPLLHKKQVWAAVFQLIEDKHRRDGKHAEDCEILETHLGRALPSEGSRLDTPGYRSPSPEGYACPYGSDDSKRPRAL